MCNVVWIINVLIDPPNVNTKQKKTTNVNISHKNINYHFLVTKQKGNFKTALKDE